jgi:hypothetical protein
VAPAWSTRASSRNVGVDHDEWSGFAFGCGIERVAQLKYDFPTSGRSGTATSAC